MLKVITLTITAFLLLIKSSYACKDSYKNSSETGEIAIWLGNNSKFSKAYKKGKCSLDKALELLPESQKRVIANLIAKSYRITEKKQDDTLSSYNY